MKYDIKTDLPVKSIQPAAESIEMTGSHDLNTAYWERYRRGWHDDSVNLFDLREQVRSSLRLRPNDVCLRMLLGSLDRDLG